MHGRHHVVSSEEDRYTVRCADRHRQSTNRREHCIGLTDESGTKGLEDLGAMDLGHQRGYPRLHTELLEHALPVPCGRA